jgi:hypothetical protein
MKVSTVFLAAAAHAQILDDEECYSGRIRVDCDTFLPFPALGDSPLLRRRKKGKGKNEGKKPREDKVDIPSTYGDLATIAGKVWNINGLKKKESFNAADFWAYGCFCHQLTGNPMSEIGKGKPIDALDTACHSYKVCLSCAASQFGETCTNDAVSYRWVYKRRNKSIYTKEDENSCEAALFSCDLAFAEQMFGSRELAQAGSGQWFNGFDENESCTNLAAIGGDDLSDSSAMSQGRFVAVEHQCCGGNGNPFVKINPAKQQCCSGKAASNEVSCT